MIVPIILCGGAGSRLWPLSREGAPKQFLPLAAGRSTFAMTLERVADRVIFDRPLIVANIEHRFLITEALRVAGVEAEMLLEPVRRDTAAAIACAVKLIARRDANALALVLAADHVIRDNAGFRNTVVTAKNAAERDYLVTFGVVPDRPATSYGYIRRGAALPGLPDVAVVKAFQEKPDAANAERYVADGYLWNSGNFLMRASLAVAEIARHAPEIAAAADKSVDGIVTTAGTLRLPLEQYKAAPTISFDYALMERTERAAVVEARFDWCDLGGWVTLGELAGTDDAGNAMIGDVVAQESRGSYIHATRGQVAVLGVENLIVATDGDGVLVAARDRIDSVKALVAEIDRRRSEKVDEAKQVVAPWGYFRVIEDGAGYKVKRLVVEPGARLSLQKHVHRAEHWVVVAGVADVTVGDETSRLAENQSIFISRGDVHRLANPGEQLLIVIEVQYGDYLGDDDIIRLEDDYRRMVD